VLQESFLSSWSFLQVKWATVLYLVKNRKWSFETTRSVNKVSQLCIIIQNYCEAGWKLLLKLNFEQHNSWYDRMLDFLLYWSNMNYAVYLLQWIRILVFWDNKHSIENPKLEMSFILVVSLFERNSVRQIFSTSKYVTLSGRLPEMRYKVLSGKVTKNVWLLLDIRF